MGTNKSIIHHEGHEGKRTEDGKINIEHPTSNNELGTKKDGEERKIRISKSETNSNYKSVKNGKKMVFRVLWFMNSV